ncbi:hypothetical protein J7I88_25610 [Paraburkholderia strydomiana]|nr:hypothetical protein [Paraburkholderia strydomiana]
MNRPLALIQGTLALPSARPLSGLPPPFGSWRRSTSHRQQRAPQAAIPGVPRYAASANRRGRISQNAKILFLYKLPQRRDDPHRFDEQLAEAKRYLQADHARPRSSRSDHILGAAIFVSCSMALAWLLATCSTHEVAGSLGTAARPSMSAIQAGPVIVNPLANVRPALVKTASKAVETHSTITHALSSVKAPLLDAAHPVETPSLSQRAEPQRSTNKSRHTVAADRVAKLRRSAAVGHAIDAGIEQHARFSRPIESPVHPSLSSQPETATSQPSANDSVERAALRDWAVQQRRANVSVRASVPPPGDIDWNAHMTQRRITDNPAAFQTGHAQQ